MSIEIESSIVAQPSVRKIDLFLCFLLFILSITVTLFLAQKLPFPGHGDPCYYIDVAKNMYEGRGFIVDYTAYFHRTDLTLPRPAGDYWMPLTSFLFYLVFKISAPTFAATQIFGAFLSTLLIIAIYLSGRFLFHLSPFWSIVASLFYLFDIDVLFNTLVPHSTVVYTFLVFLFIVIIELQGIFEKSYSSLIVGIFLGLFHLTRPDGILWWPVLLLFLLLFFRRSKSFTLTLKHCVFLMCGYLLIMMPWFIRNIEVFGQAFPVPSSTFPFLTDYEQIYSVNRDFTLSTYLDWGWHNIIASKLDEARRNFETIFHFRAIIVLFLLALPRFRHLKSVQLMFVFLVILWSFMSFMLTLPGNSGSHGSFHHAFPAIIPFLYLLMSAGAARIHEFIIDCSRERLKKALFVAFFTAFGALFCYNLFAVYELYGYNEGMVVKEMNQLYMSLNEMNEVLPDGAVIMTRNPWEVSYVTGKSAVQIPSDGLHSVISIAQKFGVTHLLISDERRQFLDEFISTHEEEIPCIYKKEINTHIFTYEKLLLYDFPSRLVEDAKKE